MQFTAKQLLRHTVILGASGSGKTVLGKTLLENLSLRRLPWIAFDTQGDLASLAISAQQKGNGNGQGNGSAQNRHRCKGQNQNIVPTGTGRLEGAKHSGLGKRAKQDDCGNRIASHVRLWIPGITHAIDPTQLEPMQAAQSMASLLGVERCQLSRNLLTALLTENRPQSIGELIQWAKHGILDTPKAKELAPKSKRDRMGFSLAGLNAGAQGAMLNGNPLDIGEMIRARGNVICTWHLSQEQQRQVLAYVAQGIYNAMMADPISKLRCLFFIDEIAPFLPPVRAMACKDAIMMLMRQARKYGVSMLLASQSPGDIDYKALANVSTWILGKIVANQDLAKVKKALQSLGRGDIVDSLPRQNAGEFVGLHGSEVSVVKSRWLYTEHRALSIEEAEQWARR